MLLKGKDEVTRLYNRFNIHGDLYHYTLMVLKYWFESMWQIICWKWRCKIWV